MFGRGLHHAYQHAARHVHSAYSHARNFAHHIDRTFSVVNRVAQAVQKPLADYAPDATRRVSARADTARQEYESLRTKLTNADSLVHRTGAAVRSSVPELGL
jgi:ABC-type Zn2+ transport system substrate-binding protein/surface adhesin